MSNALAFPSDGLLSLLQLPAVFIAPWLGWALLQGTLLALVTWVLIRWPLRRMHPAIHGALWLLVLVKFLVPVGPAMPASLASLTTGWIQPWLPAAVAPSQVAASSSQSGALELQMVLLDTAAPVTATAAPTVSGPSPAQNWIGSLVALYLLAAGAIAALRLRAYWGFLVKSESQPLAPPSVARAVEEICGRVGVKRMPVTRLSFDAPAPYIYGIWRPVLVLSPRQLTSADELEAAVLHEIAHIRRADLLVRHVQWLTGTLLFFWPVVAWVNRRIDWSRECACDEWALRHGRFSASQYARCLLRAAQPFKPGWIGYSPAAMAAYPSMVERRIEVILNTSHAKSQNWMGPAAVALLVCWAGFVLTGASAADKPKPAESQDKVEAAGVWEAAAPEGDFTFFVAADGATPEIVVQGSPLMNLPLLGHFFAAQSVASEPAFEIQCDGNADGQPMAFAFVGAKVSIANFAAEHPGADADADGEVSPAEHDAYLIARALLDPAAVLAQFPHADRDADGKLIAEEAARLISGMAMMRTHALHTHMIGGDGAVALPGKRVMVRHIGDAPPEITVDGEKIDAETAENMKERGEILVQRLVLGKNGQPGQQIQTRVALGQPNLAAHMPPAVWILENVEGEPSAADVARYVPLAGETPLRVFQERHPEADTDADGKVTPAERDAFMEARTAQMRQEILAKNPSADLDGDGVLSTDELKQFHLSKIPGELRLKVQGAAGMGAGEDVIIIKGDKPEDR